MEGGSEPPLLGTTFRTLGLHFTNLTVIRFISTVNRIMGNVLSLSLAGSIAFPLSIGALIGVGLAPEVKGWYSTLRKPTWNPPNWIFGPVWSVFYTVMGVASWRVWKAGGGAVPLSLYGAQLLLNFIWSPIFFKAHNLKAACADITALLGILVATVYEFSKVDETSAYLMIPYIGWVSFAAALTYKITELNPDKVCWYPLFMSLPTTQLHASL